MPEFEETEEERMIRNSVSSLMDEYEDDYWREIEEERGFPEEVWQDLADHGYVGIAIPEEYGGEGMGIKEMVTVMEEVGMNGGWSATVAFVLNPIFGGETLVAHGTEEQKEQWLPKIASGDAKWALGVTEPDAGLNTSNISTIAEKDGDGYVINGSKIWTSRVAEADRITLLARTLPPEDADSPTHGLSIFLVDPDSDGIDYDEIPLDIYFERTYNLYLDDVRVHESQIVGTEHQGLYHIFDTLNTERITVAAAAVAAGYSALDQAADYANDREVFGVPIGSHQAIQHPLADAYAELETAKLMTHKAAWMYDNDKPSQEVGAAANSAKLQAGKAAWNACEAAMTTFGGMSASSEIGIAKLWSMVRHLRVAPVSEQMVRNYLAENELGLPRSY
ncbi:acyl-CoA dehydrogenase family protein [Halorubrum amylolyticum]|uniref:acyl-CoA dehydrogenase family protein n=1 Tax=Halorubrum amylolyticum TaxID=2508724 RepID=UPI0010088050|nr:acyl-CoA dehydrogenase family protein [Halorubrum amylolyticum]